MYLHQTQKKFSSIIHWGSFTIFGQQLEIDSTFKTWVVPDVKLIVLLFDLCITPQNLDN